ncbi:MAG: tRNA 2-thiocytidine biosynthesis TtcA family protein [Bacillota bacterium]
MRKNWGQWFLTDVKRAIKDYEMIAPADKIAVGISGGKDSMALLHILSYLRDYSHLSFSLEAVFVDPGWQKTDFSAAAAFCADRKVPLHIVQYPIAQIIAEKGERSACSLCAKLRMGLLNSRAKALGCRRVALGHHLDDVIETFFLNLLYAGTLKTFRPAIYLDRIGLHLIRPLCYLPERTVGALVAREGIPVLPSLCPYAGKTRRSAMKEIVRCFTEKYPEFHARFRCALENVSFNDLWRQRRPIIYREGKSGGGARNDRDHG